MRFFADGGAPTAFRRKQTHCRETTFLQCGGNGFAEWEIFCEIGNILLLFMCKHSIINLRTVRQNSMERTISSLCCSRQEVFVNARRSFSASASAETESIYFVFIRKTKRRSIPRIRFYRSDAAPEAFCRVRCRLVVKRKQVSDKSFSRCVV